MYLPKAPSKFVKISPSLFVRSYYTYSNFKLKYTLIFVQIFPNVLKSDQNAFLRNSNFK